MDDRSEKTQLMLQPADGTYLVAVHHPFKYALNLDWGKEFLFNLQDDPMERKNLISSVRGSIVQQLKDDLTRLLINQRLVEENRIWPE